MTESPSSSLPPSLLRCSDVSKPYQPLPVVNKVLDRPDKNPQEPITITSVYHHSKPRKTKQKRIKTASFVEYTQPNIEFRTRFLFPVSVIKALGSTNKIGYGWAVVPEKNSLILYRKVPGIYEIRANKVPVTTRIFELSGSKVPPLSFPIFVYDYDLIQNTAIIFRYPIFLYKGGITPAQRIRTFDRQLRESELIEGAYESLSRRHKITRFFIPAITLDAVCPPPTISGSTPASGPALRAIAEANTRERDALRRALDAARSQGVPLVLDQKPTPIPAEKTHREPDRRESPPGGPDRGDTPV